MTAIDHAHKARHHVMITETSQVTYGPPEVQP